ncbi:biotin-dependent carboxyltransferase family protein [Marinobacter sp. SS21]|uniref:5-oxoprolinase subunit C family protein n=1 Tax=Marinobacter sp. SS21 TaxID=2979460 RepID=UPI0023302F42|nr:biotin-dependent carboxyltransferase family protein [Marinobacter sp. SS21]MDC0661827.1 biotin-dependent carboxyltransferase family protein [Marinobacter sp. SS21]
MKLLRVIAPGPRTTVQDSGRRHFQKHGLAEGGAADRHAFLWANKLLDNDLNAACLEITLGGFEAEALAHVSIALTGADTRPRINGIAVAMWQTLQLTPGDRLSMTSAASGRYCYLAIRGGLQAPTLFGSATVVVREQFDELRPLARGDTLTGFDTSPAKPARMPVADRPIYGAPLKLRLIPGYQYSQFSQTDRARFLSSEYRVSTQSDRMGFKLEGAALQDPPPGIVSEGIALGSVQVPGDGDPIVLLKDRQTIGGYPKLGTLCALDCYRLAQAQPGQAVGFEVSDIATTQNERMLFESMFRNTHWNKCGDGLAW